MAVHKDCQITLSPSGRTFIQRPGQTLLEAGLAAGLPLPYRCSNGSCGECRARVVEGSVSKQRFHDYVLNESERLRGECLMCSNSASTDTVIEVHEASSVEDIPVQNLQAKICHIEHLDKVLLARLKFTRGNALRFLPGQCVQLSLPNDMSLTLPISSCPCESSVIEFHLISQGTGSLLEEANDRKEVEFGKSFLRLGSRDRVRVVGPFGGVAIAAAPCTPQLFLATGIEFRFLQGLIEQLFSLETAAPMALLWLGSDEIPRYRSNLCRSWSDVMDEFKYLSASSIGSLMEKIDTSMLNNFSGATIYCVGAEHEILSSLLQRGLECGQVIDLDRLAKQSAAIPAQTIDSRSV